VGAWDLEEKGEKGGKPVKIMTGGIVHNIHMQGMGCTSIWAIHYNGRSAPIVVYLEYRASGGNKSRERLKIAL